jgi:hypothetical protein
MAAERINEEEIRAAVRARDWATRYASGIYFRPTLRGYPETGLGKRCVLIDSWRIPYPQGVRRHATGRTAPQDVSLGFDG